MRDKLVPLVLPQQLLEVIQEGKALLVGNAAEGIIRIFTLQVHDQFRELMILSEIIDAVGQSLPTNDSTKVSMGLTMDGR